MATKAQVRQLVATRVDIAATEAKYGKYRDIGADRNSPTCPNVAIRSMHRSHIIEFGSPLETLPARDENGQIQFPFPVLFVCPACEIIVNTPWSVEPVVTGEPLPRRHPRASAEQGVQDDH